MVSALKLMLQQPTQAANFIYCFVTQLLLVVLHRILLPHYPRYQSLRIEAQKAYLSSTALHFPQFTHRLPADYSERLATPIAGKGWHGYTISGESPRSIKDAANPKLLTIVLYAHGGGYARGEARMYLWYFKRWIAVAKSKGLEVMFLSVEYPLSGEASHPAQRSAFLAAYRHLLEMGILSSNIIFMGDSAGGGLSVMSAIQARKEQLPQPAGSILISPWMDMSLSAYEGGNQAVMSDFLVTANTAVPVMTNAFLGGFSGSDPEVNPLYQPTELIRSLNPQLIFVGAAEFALSDSKHWAQRCQDAGIKCELHVAWGQMHVWALGSSFIEPALRDKTDARMVEWMIECVHGKSDQ
ncbi:Alpha/Beta hydrolase protein [Paraphoma chrysanthemicola]|nr:Alpha/Beta hydrolase protein [Paraphoma chrysanthemicola]